MPSLTEEAQTSLTFSNTDSKEYESLTTGRGDGEVLPVQYWESVPLEQCLCLD